MNIIIRLFLFLGISTPLWANPIEAFPLLKTTSSWDGSSLPSITPGQTEFNITRYKVAPKTKTAIHLHPLNGVGYIISGELTMYATEDPHGSFSDKTKVKQVILKAGQSWTETVNTWHYGENNTDKEVELILMFVGPTKTPLSLSLND